MKLVSNKKLFITILFAGFLLSGCATILGGGSTQDITVQAVDKKSHDAIPHAVCGITDSKGRQYVITGNPGTTMVERGQGALVIKCEERGYRQTQVASGNSLNAWLIGDVLFWPGAIVDVVTGSAQKYPSHITVIMERQAR